MLKNLTAEEQKLVRSGEMWNFFSTVPTYPHEGMVVGDLNQDMLYDNLIDSSNPFSRLRYSYYEILFGPLPHDDPYKSSAREQLLAYDESLPEDFGVCDYPAQIVEKWPTLITDEERYIIFLTEIRKDEETESGGWRWHKWGEYIGTQESTTEYIFDEPVIESVYVFHIHTLRENLVPKDGN